MLPSKKPRVIRVNKPKRTFTEHTYRKAKPFLLADFEGRCAYSLQHIEKIGWKDMEIDHHDPTLDKKAKQRYENLFPASRHCNGSKSDYWPDKNLKKLNIRFLNPCQENDYGEQIFENPKTHLLVGMTPAAIYHIRVLQLNAAHLVQERMERSVLGELLNQTPALIKNAGLAIPTAVDLRRIIDIMIPLIPAPPAY